MAKEKNIVKVIDGVGFYPASYEKKTEAEFMDEQKHLVADSILSEDQLRNAYSKLASKVETVNPVSETKKPAKPSQN